MILNCKLLVILFVLVAIVIGFIFSNSMQNSVESHRASGIIEEIVKPIICRICGNDAVDINYIVRKGAHLAEFCLLGLAVMGVIFTVGLKYFGYGLFSVLLVAVTDEYIQSFFDRTSSVKDVLIDFTGAMMGFVIGAIVFLIVQKIKKKDPNNVSEKICYNTKK